MILCGKQGLALRGHRDDGIDLIEEEDDKVSENYGNFLELVHFRAETDAALRKHLEHAPKNALYTSKTIQNELIKVIGSRIQSDIISEVKEAMFYSIIADEVTDIANRSSCLWYCATLLTERSKRSLQTSWRWKGLLVRRLQTQS